VTIANGSPILAADLDALTSTQLALLAADAGQLPLAGEVSLVFPGLTTGLHSSNPERCQASFTAPYDLLIEAVAVQAGDHTAASTTTVTLSCPGVLDAFSVVVSGTTGAGLTKLARVLYDNAGKGPARAVRVIPRGAVVDVFVDTTSAAAASMLQVVVAFRAFFART
jgi:hypothetical protein